MGRASMPHKHSYEVQTACELPEAFAIYCDISRWQNRGIYGNIQWVEGEPWRVGSRLEFDLRFPGFLKVRQLVSTFERNSRVGLITHASGITLHTNLMFSAALAGGTRIEASLEAVGITAILFGFAIDTAIDQTLRRFLDDLKHDCDNFAASEAVGD